MAANTVEATLVSRYQDGVSKGIEATVERYVRDND